MSSFAPSLIEQVRFEVSGAAYGHRGEVAGRWAKLLNMSRSQLYNLIGYDSEKTRVSAPARPEYREWVPIIFQIKKRPPEEAGEISTDQAVRIAVNAGLIPAAALDVPVETFDRIGRDLKLNKKKVRRNRFQAARPNDVHHFDASTSKFFYIHKKDAAEYILRLHRPAKHYKNKPIPVDALRPWIYGLVDDHSGYPIARYTAAQGESVHDSLLFLAYAWAAMGLSKSLWADQGMLKKGLASQDLIMRLGVELPEFEPYAKEAHGKIERIWRTIWQRFEKHFFAVLTDWHKFEISMTELNAEFSNYLVEYRNQPHRFERDVTRLQAWNRVNLYGGIVALPENALATVAKRKKRKVDVDGTMEYEGKTYEVKGLHDAWVYVYEGVFEDCLVVDEIETGQKFEVKDFKPLGIGEFRAHPETPHEKLVKESAALPLKGHGLYADKAETNEKITAIPTRTKETRELEDPFNVAAFANMAEAMAEFTGIVGTAIDKDQREVIERLISEQGMDKQFIRDLALEIRGTMERRRAINE